MITMSFGFQEDIPQIRIEIKEAVHNGKIVFAAASNDGGNSPRAFPALQPGVICVHSTDSNGNSSPYNPSPKERRENFSILGQYINSSWPGANEAGASRRMTGTSFAAPVAVALAAFIIGFVQQEIPDLGTPTELKSYDGIASLFQLFVKSNGQRDGYDWIAPFEFFHRFHPSKIREDIKYALTP
jgi:subtilisin family serine protease